MPKAPASSRSSGHVTLTFGLINIPVTLYSGTVASHGVERHEYLPVETTKDDGSVVTEDHPIGRGPVDKTTGQLLTPEERGKVVKKIETEYGPVFVEDSEIEKLFTLEPDTFKVKEFQPQHLFYQGNYVPKSLMFVEPSKSGSGKKKAYMPVALKLYGTLLKSMREQGAIAVGELTTRGVPKPAILTPDGALWLVWHTDAIREQRELPEVDLVEAEVQAMSSLIQAMLKTEPADLSDVRSEMIQNFADEKAAAGDFGKPEAGDYKPSAPAEPQVDLMAMLAASVEAAKRAS